MNETNPSDQNLIRIRRSTNMISWAFAPLLILAIAFWLVLNLAACWSGRATLLILRLCSQAHLIPDLFALFATIALLRLAIVLHRYGRQWGYPPPPERIWNSRQAAEVRYGYRQLDDTYKSYVKFSLEMAGWAATIAIATLIYYWFELSFPLGIVVLVGLATAVFRLGRQLMSFFNRFLGKGPTTTSTGGGPTIGSPLR